LALCSSAFGIDFAPGGPRATAGAVARRVRKLAYLREEHVWYGCDLNATTARAELPGGLRLVRADGSQVDSVVAIGQDLQEARERLEAGIDLWVVLEGERPVFI
jgi:hypothetical protein